MKESEPGMKTQALRKRGPARATRVFLVVGVAGLIASFAFVCSRFQNASIPTPESYVSQLSVAASAWQLVHEKSVCPTVAQLIRDKELDPAFPTADPWGNAYGIECSGGELITYSMGPDEERGTADDITKKSSSF